jgi:excisionase family DNA binding protein
MEPLLLGRKEAAAALGICLRMLDYKIAHGELAVRRVGRRVLIPRVELEKFATTRDPAKTAGTDDTET